MSEGIVNHRKKVNRLVKSTLAFTFLFGINSALYLTAQNNFEDLLSQKEAVRALNISADIDEITFKYKIDSKTTACEDPGSDSCKNLLESLIQLKNRMYDYQMIFWNTLGLKRDSKEIINLVSYENKIDLVIEEYFGLSPKQAKQRGITSLDQYMSVITSDRLMKSSPLLTKKFLREVELTRGEAYEYLSKTISDIEARSIQVESSIRKLETYLFILISLEIIVFLLVNYIDIINNNFTPKVSS